MLAELESGLVALVKASPLATRLRQVETLPDLEGDTLVTKLAADAPAVYVATGSFQVRGGYAQPKFGVACVARNSRSPLAARHGDGVAIGMLEMADVVMSLLDGASVEVAGERVAFAVTSCDMVSSETLYKAGLYVAVVQLQAPAEVRLSLPVDAAALADFKTFHSDYDIEPFASAAEHDKWLAEPPDHTGSAPELSDTLNLQE